MGIWGPGLQANDDAADAIAAVQEMTMAPVADLFAANLTCGVPGFLGLADWLIRKGKGIPLYILKQVREMAQDELDDYELSKWDEHREDRWAAVQAFVNRSGECAVPLLGPATRSSDAKRHAIDNAPVMVRMGRTNKQMINNEAVNLKGDRVKDGHIVTSRKVVLVQIEPMKDADAARFKAFKILHKCIEHDPDQREVILDMVLREIERA